MVAWGRIRGASVGSGEGRGLAGLHSWICIIGAMRLGRKMCGWFAVGL